MSVPNQTGLLEPGLAAVHQDFLGTLAGLAERQVSPASMLQKTRMASLALPPSGSIQYSPGRVKVDGWAHTLAGSSRGRQEVASPYHSSCEGGRAGCPGRFWPGSFCSRQDCAGLPDACAESSAWRGLQRLRAEQPPSCWDQPGLCSSLEPPMEPLQLRRPQTPPSLQRRRSPRNRTRQQRGLQRLQLEDLGVQGVQGVLAVLLHPDRRKMDAF